MFLTIENSATAQSVMIEKFLHGIIWHGILELY